MLADTVIQTDMSSLIAFGTAVGAGLATGLSAGAKFLVSYLSGKDKSFDDVTMRFVADQRENVKTLLAVQSAALGAVGELRQAVASLSRNVDMAGKKAVEAATATMEAATIAAANVTAAADVAASKLANGAK